MTIWLNVETAVNDAKVKLESIGECERMLVSPMLFEAFRRRLEINWVYLYMSDKNPGPKSGEVYFKGVPVLKCERLRDLEFSFVK
jgi:hypothetical protein